MKCLKKTLKAKHRELKELKELKDRELKDSEIKN